MVTDYVEELLDSDINRMDGIKHNKTAQKGPAADRALKGERKKKGFSYGVLREPRRFAFVCRQLLCNCTSLRAARELPQRILGEMLNVCGMFWCGEEAAKGLRKSYEETTLARMGHTSVRMVARGRFANSPTLIIVAFA